MPTADELRAALAVAELEEELAAAKAALMAEAEERAADVIARLAASTDPDEIRQLADELRAAQDPGRRDRAGAEKLREARRAYREMRDAQPPGEGVARPAVIEAGVAVPTPDEVN